MLALRATPWALALLLMLPFLLAPLPAAEAATTTRVLTITTDSANPDHPFKAFDGNPPKVYDIDGNGKKEIVAQNDNKYVYVFDSKTGKLLAELTTTHPPGWGARDINGPEVTFLEQGGAVHLIVVNSAAYVTVFKYVQTNGDGTFKFTKLWERRLTECHDNPGADSKPVLADLDYDGDFEILVQTEEVGVYALTHTGGMFWKQCIGGGNAEPTVGDLDNDGGRDVVWVSDAGVVTAMTRLGGTKWDFWAGDPDYGLGSASIPVGATVTQVDGTGGQDVVFGARDSSDCNNFNNNHAMLFALKGNGALLWNRQPSQATPLTYTHPMVWDVDADGKKDVIWADWNTQGHDCGNWEVVGQSHVYRYTSSGELKWTTTMDAWWHNKDLALADVDDDGTHEVLANGPSQGKDGVWYLNAKTGAKETFVSASPWKVSRGPVISDFWKTNTMQWVIPVVSSDDSEGAILVYDTHAPVSYGWWHVPYPKL